MRVLVFGASGMLGNAMLRVLDEKKDLDVIGTVRSESALRFFQRQIADQLITGCEIEDDTTLAKVFDQVRPHVVINCVGVIKQLAAADDPLLVIPINTLFPHKLAKLCKLSESRLVHISTDCVFSGEKGGYSEADKPDASDLYGRSKLLGEVTYPHTITLRTSMIGHELQSAHGLVNWFLSQQGTCKGYNKAIFSGLPAVVLAQIIRDIVIPRPDLFGIYHVAGKPISKYDLLQLIAKEYKKEIAIIPDEEFSIDRSLNAERFKMATGYNAPAWPELISTMHAYK